jgi:hypothetical protein
MFRQPQTKFGAFCPLLKWVVGGQSSVSKALSFRMKNTSTEPKQIQQTEFGAFFPLSKRGSGSKALSFRKGIYLEVSLTLKKE